MSTVVYEDCGCEAGGDNIALFCPVHSKNKIAPHTLSERMRAVGAGAMDRRLALELGIPNVSYAAPVANAHGILKAAVAKANGE